MGVKVSGHCPIYTFAMRLLVEFALREVFRVGRIIGGTRIVKRIVGVCVCLRVLLPVVLSRVFRGGVYGEFGAFGTPTVVRRILCPGLPRVCGYAEFCLVVYVVE